MTKRVHKTNGAYVVKGKKYSYLVGSRAQVWHNTAYKTTGGLKKSDLVMNKHGRIVSRTKQATAKREKRLEKHGYFAEKGKFGAVRNRTRRSRKSSRRTHRRRRR
jgi:hypothetical protein